MKELRATVGLVIVAIGLKVGGELATKNVMKVVLRQVLGANG